MPVFSFSMLHYFTVKGADMGYTKVEFHAVYETNNTIGGFGGHKTELLIGSLVLRCIRKTRLLDGIFRIIVFSLVSLIIANGRFSYN